MTSTDEQVGFICSTRERANALVPSLRDLPRAWKTAGERSMSPCTWSARVSGRQRRAHRHAEALRARVMNTTVDRNAGLDSSDGDSTTAPTEVLKIGGRESDDHLIVADGLAAVTGVAFLLVPGRVPELRTLQSSRKDAPGRSANAVADLGEALLTSRRRRRRGRSGLLLSGRRRRFSLRLLVLDLTLLMLFAVAGLLLIVVDRSDIVVVARSSIE